MSNKNNIDLARHSCSHLLAAAVLNLYPNTKLGIGPIIENGFYYDFQFKKPISEEDLPKIEAEMKKLQKDWQKFEKLEKTIDEAKEIEKDEPFKLELIDELGQKGEKISFYKSGNFIDLCKGPHVEKASEIGHFKLLSIAGAYWKGSEKNPMLTRIYGICFPTQKELEDYFKMVEEAKKRDHKKIGQELDLFSFHKEGAGFPFWHPNGMIIKNTIIEFWRKEHEEAGYKEIQTPIILKEELWHQSGHWENYKENMYFTKIDSDKYAVKPMNCPGGIQIYKSTLHSYRDFPLRIAELGLVHRHELSGVLNGLFRVRAFTQDDAHIYCTDQQIEQEIEGVIKLVEKIYKVFGFNNYHIELSTKPQKHIGSEEIWNKSEKIMKDVVKKMKMKIKINEGDGAFYGPKFDFHIKDSIGRTWQCATIQLDFSMPERFNLEYVDKTGERKRPVMIHRTVFGSFERFIGILLEHYGGNLPLWLSPYQIAILPITDKHNAYSEKIKTELEKEKIRVYFDNRNERLQAKIRQATLQKVPFMGIIGDKEVNSGKNYSISVRTKDGKDLGTLNLSQFVKRVKIEIDKKI